jgi:hypothetical protein
MISPDFNPCKYNYVPERDVINHYNTIASLRNYHGAYYVYYKLLKVLAYYIIEKLLKMQHGDCTVVVNDELISPLNNLVLRLPLNKHKFIVNINEYKDITEEMMRDYMLRGVYVHTYEKKCSGAFIEDAHLAKIIFLRHCLFPIDHEAINKPYRGICPTTERFTILGSLSVRSKENYDTICKMYELCNGTEKEDKEASNKIIKEQTEEKEKKIEKNENEQSEKEDKEASNKIIKEQTEEKEKNIENRQSSLAIICAIPGTGKSTTGTKYKEQGYFTYDRDEEAERIIYPFIDGEKTLGKRLEKPYGIIDDAIGKLDLNVSFKRYITFTLRILCRNIYKHIYTHIVREVQKNLIEVARKNGVSCMCESVGFTSDLALVVPFNDNYQIDIIVMDKDKIYNQQGQRMLTQNRGSLYFTICKFEAALKDFIRKCKTDHADHTSIIRALDSRTETEDIVLRGQPQNQQLSSTIKNAMMGVWNENFISNQPTYIILLITCIIGLFYIIYTARNKIIFDIFSSDRKFVSGGTSTIYNR